MYPIGGVKCILVLYLLNVLPFVVPSLGSLTVGDNIQDFHTTT